ncbi:hypothetical protein [Polyangium aurulentum]|uniref:hypothetical protein n=1 Tax=Polyangium aurulentum TaxID=2567896 RepID=UPI0010AE64F4|nr:hypothetical protein [Polyangium aurulentum]UQA62122.1 hypothetical protein E8A73_017265 [Polyangium aurulentum]
MALAGCHDDRAPVEAAERAAEPIVVPPGARLSGMAVAVSSVRADRAIDLGVVRAAMREAENAFLACLDPDGSTGVLALRISIETDGTVGDVSQQPTTTYGTDEARSCMERIVSAMRYPTAESRERFELDLSLEVRPRRDNE